MRSISSHSVLGIDLGASSVKVVALGADGRPLAEATAGYDVTAPDAGQAESDPGAWWSATVAAVHECLSQAGPAPAAIGLSGQMHGVVLTGELGQALRPAILWPDSRAVAEVAAYRRLPAGQLRQLMNPLAPGMAGPMLLWLATHEPGHYRSAAWALQPKDWLRMQLTGIAASDPSDASATLLYDVPADRWHIELVEALGLEKALLPPLLRSAAQAGVLTRAAADALGLVAGTPVVTGAGDTAAGILGTGLTPGQVQMSIGSGIQIVTLRDAAIAADEPVTHLYRTAEDHGWYALAAILSGGIALDWVRRLLGADWPELYASATRPGRLEDPVFLPHLAGERTPYLDPDLRGAWVGLGLGHDRTTLLRSALEGVAFAAAEALEALDSPGNGVTATMRLSGRGSTAAAWRQLLANVLGRPVVASASTNASGNGAALLAARLLGWPPGPGRTGRAALEAGETRPAESEADLVAERRRRFAASVAALRFDIGDTVRI
jgi:xylulokinase